MANRCKRQLTKYIAELKDILGEKEEQLNAGSERMRKYAVMVQELFEMIDRYWKELQTDHGEEFDDTQLDEFEDLQMNVKVVVRTVDALFPEIMSREQYQERLDQETKLKAETSMSPEQSFQLQVMQIESDEKIALRKAEVDAEVRLQSFEKGEKPSSKSGTKSKLPKLEIPKFRGDVEKWPEFWDIFMSSIHNNPELRAIDKFGYLRSYLEGDAKTTVEGFTMTDENYDQALDLLKERYDKRDIIRQVFYAKIKDLPPSTQTTKSLRSTYDVIESCFRSLSAMDDDFAHLMMMDVYCSKWPDDLQRKLKKTQSASLAAWRCIVREYIEARENVELSSKATHSVLPPSDSSSHPRVVQSGSRRWNVEFRPSSRPGLSNQSFSNRSFPNRSFSSSSALLNEEDVPAPVAAHPADASLLVPPSINRKPVKMRCIYCDVCDHWSDECPKTTSLQDRKEVMKRQNRCSRCASLTHLQGKCSVNYSCVRCGKFRDHHRSLCPKLFPQSVSATLMVDDRPAEAESSFSIPSSSSQILLKTAMVHVVSSESKDGIEVRMLLDSGSHGTFISERLAKKMNLKYTSTRTQWKSINAFGETQSKPMKYHSADIRLRTKDGLWKVLSVSVVPHISNRSMRATIDCNSMQFISQRGVQLADPPPTAPEAVEVDFLLGNDYYDQIILSEKVEISPGLFLIDSTVGWILSGRSNVPNTQDAVMSVLNISQGIRCDQSFEFEPPFQTSGVNPPHNRINDLWSLDSLGIRDDISVKDDDMAINLFDNSVRFNEALKRYEVKFPWKEDLVPLPSNYALALGRLRSTCRKLQNDPDLTKRYDEVICDQEKKGVIEIVPEILNEDVRTHYIPHHAVVTPHKSTTKVRIVYDASAKCTKNQPSLNECLYRGPVILEDLCGLLMRFRMHSIAIVADIEKAFLQIEIQSEDRDVLRFLWLKNPNLPPNDSNLLTYRFRRVPFGVISSPFLLGATLRHHLLSKNSSVATKIMNHLYVDNLITGADFLSDATRLYDEAKQIFKEMSMNLREWGSNSSTFTSHIPVSDQMSDSLTKVLGVQWNQQTDNLSINPLRSYLASSCVTKRVLLQAIASIYDPLGLVSPLLLNGKLILQDAWRRQLQWDSSLDDDLLKQWNLIHNDLQSLNLIKVPRYIGCGASHLLVFCDASSRAYSASVYLKTDQGVFVVFAKCRPNPTADITIPRAELLAVVMGVKVLKFVQRQLQLAGGVKMILWTDSKCVHHWIKSKRQLGTFVHNRVFEIKQSTDVNFRYVSSGSNPADVGSRGATFSELQSSNLWWHGPSWLQRREDEWPDWDVPEITPDVLAQVDQEQRKPPLFEVGLLINDNKPDAPYGINIARYSSLRKLLRVTVLVIKFIDKLKRRHVSLSIDSTNMAHALYLWENYVQKSVLDSPDQRNLLSQLDARRSEADGLIRCNGRLVTNQNQPILLPRNHPFTHLLIQDCHSRCLHAGVSYTLGKVRERYWISKGRTEVKKVILKCGVCRRYQGGPYTMPLMACYPDEKCLSDLPFSITGLDYFGPINIKLTHTGPVQKSWVCLFTCITTRAIHLELVMDMSAEQFLCAFRRFVARRGSPRKLISDNAGQFKPSKSVISFVWKDVAADVNVTSYMANHAIEWKFLIELAPWTGGFYERLVGIVKMALKKCVGSLLLTQTQFSTLLTETEAMVNSRPLVYLGEDKDQPVLSPGDFLSPHSKLCAPVVRQPKDQADDPDFVAQNIPRETRVLDLVNIWKKGERYLQCIWEMWRKEYLSSLRERFNRSVKSERGSVDRKPRIGDVVTIKESLLPRAHWKLGVITDLISSYDGEVRSARLRLANKRIINRALSLLYPLESSVTMGQGDLKILNIDQSASEVLRQRPPRRLAFIKANQKLAAVADE